MEGGGGWELITWEAFCPAPAAAGRMQMKESSCLGEKAMVRMVPCAHRRAGTDAPSSASPRPRAPLHPGGAVWLPGLGLRWIDW